MARTGGNSWEDRQKVLLTNIQRSVEHYRAQAKHARLWHRWLSGVVLVGSVFAPAAVAGGAGSVSSGSGHLAISSILSPTLALAITLVVAIAEGFRRMFRFEHRWHVCARTRGQLERAKSRYLDTVAEMEIGCSDWKAKFWELSEYYADTLEKEIEEFFAAVKAGSSEQESKEDS